MNIDLSINPELVIDILTRFIRAEITRTGLQHAVLGLSGGIDSAVVAYLAVRALGAENVLTVRMPYKTSSQDSLDHAQLVIDDLKMPALTIPITDMADGLITREPEMSSMRKGNIMARCRMIVLYDQSEAFKGLVVGTGNKTELMLGYTTLFGDSASAINPLGDLYKTQVWDLSAYLGIPDELVSKQPSADLWVGQTDEEELGLSYRMADEVLYYLVDERRGPDELSAMGYEISVVEHIQSLIIRNQFKRLPPVIAKVGSRSVNADFRYPRDWKM